MGKFPLFYFRNQNGQNSRATNELEALCRGRTNLDPNCLTQRTAFDFIHKAFSGYGIFIDFKFNSMSKGPNPPQIVCR